MTEERKNELTENYRVITDSIADALSRRPSSMGGEVRLLAATKFVPAQEIAFAVRELGVKYCGENRSEELCAKFGDPLKPYDGAKLHFIGTLQSRKVRDVADKVDMIESVDSAKLAREIDRRAAECGRVLPVLAEINIGREPNKSGALPEDFAALAAEIESCGHLELRGGMTLAPKCDDFNEYRKYFKETYNIILDFWTKKSHNIREYNSLPDPVVSMGMSDSYAAAVLEGANLVRIGSALFGPRQYR